MQYVYSTTQLFRTQFERYLSFNLELDDYLMQFYDYPMRLDYLARVYDYPTRRDEYFTRLYDYLTRLDGYLMRLDDYLI